MNNSKNSDDFSLLSISDKEEINFFSTFERIKKGNIIYNPKQYFLKIRFSNVFKNILFNDKIFNYVRLCYLIKYRKYKNINKELKQINYPSKQKNFSNILEPQMFLRRNYNFYDKIFFPISHSFINFKLLKEKEEQIYFYPHEYKIKDIKLLNDKIIYCDLVTKEYIYFGKMHFTYDFILFESEKDDPRYTPLNEIDLEEFFKYAISSKSSFSNNKKEKQKKKSILIFSTEIKEIIQRRTLLVNQSIEIFNKNGKSFFFNFFTTEQVKQVYIYLKKINNYLSEQFYFNTDNNKDDIKLILESFHKGRITNYEYILNLNKYSTRTYNDLSQYPIFPWLLLDHSKINDILNNLVNNKNVNNDLRDMKYPISAQTQEKRETLILKFEQDKEKFPVHFGAHYSNSAYIFYYLMRLNPYSQGLIELQNYKLEDPNRAFNSLKELEEIIISAFDNRELIPDFYCYIDFFINLNCSFYGIKNVDIIIDDCIMDNFIPNKYVNTISTYINLLYNLKRLLNHRYISEKLNAWVDNIFGKKQLPKKDEKYKDSCNIFKKQSYEQKLNLEKKIEKYKQQYKLNKNNKTKIYGKFINKVDIVTFFGMVPKQILFDSNLYGGDNKTPENIFKRYISGKDKYIYFTKLSNDNFLILKKDVNNKTKTKNLIICENNISKGKIIFDCKYINSLKYRRCFKIKEKCISLYKINYAIAVFQIEVNKYFITFVLSCRYLGNYFKIQSNDYKLNIFCEDLVTCIKERNFCNKGKNYFYTGLLNGKLTEWKIICKNNNIDNKNKIKNNFNYEIKEKKHIYAHNSSITSIEIYNSQNLIITAGEDKFIYIRKVYDFELLTVIDLTYTFGNEIISKNKNIFPSFIKISDLNLIYVLIYDYDSNQNFIRGYNLNGLFFAQTNPTNFIGKDNTYLHFNNISFTKNSDLIVWFYNSKKLKVLNAWDLNPIQNKDLIKGIINNKDTKDKDRDKNNNIIKYIEYNYNSKEFYKLYENEFIIMTSKEKEKQKFFDSF